MQTVATTLVIAAVLTVVTTLFNVGIDRQERMECEYWQHDAQQYPQFYLTHWQKEECDHAGVTINAPVE